MRALGLRDRWWIEGLDGILRFGSNEESVLCVDRETDM
jgi:hypothetical protein